VEHLARRLAQTPFHAAPQDSVVHIEKHLQENLTDRTRAPFELLLGLLIRDRQGTWVVALVDYKPDEMTRSALRFHAELGRFLMDEQVENENRQAMAVHLVDFLGRNKNLETWWGPIAVNLVNTMLHEAPLTLGKINLEQADGLARALDNVKDAEQEKYGDLRNLIVRARLNSIAHSQTSASQASKPRGPGKL
jgi:hypothetical protein